MNFEIVGYFEEVFDVQQGKCLGTRTVPADPYRTCGYYGRQEMTLIAPVVLDRGHKTITVKASRQNPLLVRTTLQTLCGCVQGLNHPHNPS